MSSIDGEEVVMLLRACLAANKHALSLHQLQGDYYEMNGTPIPFKQLGFVSLVHLLESMPDKFSVKTGLNGTIEVSPVLDNQMAALAKLVKGQKSSRKKKKKPGKKPFYSNNANFNHYRAKSHSGYNSSLQNNNSRYSSQNRVWNQDRRNSASKQGGQIKRDFSVTNYLNTHTQNRPPVKNSFNSYKNSVQIEKLIDKYLTDESKENIEDLWIANAVYYLKEHEVLVLNILSCETICIRLVGPLFSEKYESMFESLNEHYKKVSTAMQIPLNVEENKMYVAYLPKSKNFYRVQVLSVKNNMAQCCFVDEGFNENVPLKDLHAIKSDFLKIKFQAITVDLDGLKVFENNSFIMDLLFSMCNEKYIARKVENNPLTIKLYDKENNCINDLLLDECHVFRPIKLKPNDKTEGILTYFDDRKKLGYLLINDLRRRDKIREMTWTLNEFFSNADNLKPSLPTSEAKPNKICCTKLSLDNNWYRIKVLQTAHKEEALVEYMDFGNEEYVRLSEIKPIPQDFLEYEFIPAQAIPVIVIKIDGSSITELVGDERLASIEVESVNNNQIPYVKLTALPQLGNEEAVSIDNLMDKMSLCTASTVGDEEDDGAISELELEELKSNKVYEKLINWMSKKEAAKQTEPEADNSTSSLNSQIKSILSLSPPHFIKSLHYDAMRKPDLPCSGYVSITYASSPEIFSFRNFEHNEKEKLMAKEMQKFYSNKSNQHNPEQTKVNHVYVHKLNDEEYRRVKVFNFFPNGMASVYNIDIGNYDVTDINNLFEIERKFIELPVLAMSGKLAYTYKNDVSTKWPVEVKKKFLEFVQPGKVFRTSLVLYKPDTNFYVIDLFEHGMSVCKTLELELTKQ